MATILDDLDVSDGFPVRIITLMRSFRAKWEMIFLWDLAGRACLPLKSINLIKNVPVRFILHGLVTVTLQTAKTVPLNHWNLIS